MTKPNENIEQNTLAWELVALSECGQRSENQDNYLLINTTGTYRYLHNEEQQQGELTDWPENHIRLVIADGMGGHNNGRQISEALIQALITLPFQLTINGLKTSLLTIHQALFTTHHQGPKTPGSTLIMADIDANGKALVANIGDSRAFLWQAYSQHWQTLSYDHSSNEFAWRDHEIEDKDYQQNLLHSSHRIAQAVGYGSIGIIANQTGKKFRQHIDKLRIDIEDSNAHQQTDRQEKHYDISQHQLQSGDLLLLASDGLWSNQANNYQPAAYPQKTQFALKAYAIQQIRSAFMQGGDDNTSCVAAYRSPLV